MLLSYARRDVVEIDMQAFIDNLNGQMTIHPSLHACGRRFSNASQLVSPLSLPLKKSVAPFEWEKPSPFVFVDLVIDLLS